MVEQVIIVGAGLGGLCLAQGLKKAKIPFRVFERDAAESSRPQGYRLRINPDGSAALKQNLPDGLWTLFQDTCAVTALGGTTIDAISATVTENRSGPDPRRLATGRSIGDVYTADRSTLRGVLLSGLTDDVEFGREYLRYETTSNGKLVAHFVGGYTAEGDILVGADGVRSRVRKQLLPHSTPNDTSGRAIYGKTPVTPELMEQFTKNATEGLCRISDPHSVSLFLEFIRFRKDPAAVSSGALPSVNDYVYWVLGSHVRNFLHPDAELFALQPQEVADLSLRMTTEWDPSIRSLLAYQQVEQTALIRISCAPIDQSKWQTTNVTLLGDAIHCMPPTGGVGANTALHDAAILCGLLSEIGIGGVSVYEEEMLAYSGEAVRSSLGAAKRLFGLDELKPLSEE
jgi:2-polyprenyl-6-methoxyphenol hydroxylase-like FAD-dependent oxidoreductase